MSDQQQQQADVTSASASASPSASASTPASASTSNPNPASMSASSSSPSPSPAPGSTTASTANPSRSFSAHHARVTAILYDAKRRHLNPIPLSITRLANDYPYANVIANDLVNQARSFTSPSMMTRSVPLSSSFGFIGAGPPHASHNMSIYAPYSFQQPHPPHNPQYHPYNPQQIPTQVITQHHQPQQQQFHQQQPQQATGRVLFIRRISVQSVARFLGVVGALMSFIRLWIIMSLALARTIATLAQIPQVEDAIKTIAKQSITRVSDNHFFHWLVQVLSHTDPSFMLDQPVNFAGIELNSSLYLSIFLAMPLVEGALSYIIGMVIAISINIGLSVCNGIRIENDNF